MMMRQSKSRAAQLTKARFRPLAALIGVIVGTGLISQNSLSAPSSDYSSGRDVYAALTKQHSEIIKIGDSQIHLVFADGARGVNRGKVRAWITRSAQAVSTYFGRFPVREMGIVIVAQDGRGVGHGVTYGSGVAVTRINVGRDADDTIFARDWVMVHEMTHTALPLVEENSWWLLEGSATYIEPIARAQAGHISASTVWADNLRDMRKGLPKAGDRGLDNMGTWGRTYWGGAIYFLVADTMIREQTGNRKGVQDALRAISEKSGGNTAEWPIARVVAVGDEATGTNVMTTLYEAMRDAPAPVDLNALFLRLGVSTDGERLSLTDKAELAAVRRAITQAPSIQK